MNEQLKESLRDQLVNRRDRLQRVISETGEADDLRRLVQEVDSALDRMGDGTYGRCQVCGDMVTETLLTAHPTMPYCLCDMTREEQEELERDLGLAWQIQAALLPQQDLQFAGWEVHHRYHPAGPVSGDYLDVVTREDNGGTLYALLGDISGKGVSASFLMSHLNALVRSLIDVGLPLPQVLDKANRLFSESTLPIHFATLVLCQANSEGGIEICNAGHNPPILVRAGNLEVVESTGVPVGMMAETPYQFCKVEMVPGDSLFLYTDGLTEATDHTEREYGVDGVSQLIEAHPDLSSQALIDACLRDVSAHRSDDSPVDDLTIMLLRRTGQ
jgi:sigma-B regulation protein RsbU (phosphoserine phosphatase)